MLSAVTERLATVSHTLHTQQLPGRDLANLFSSGYWTEQLIPASSPYYLVTISLLIVSLIILGLTAWRYRRLNYQVPVYDWLINQLINLIIFIIVVSVSYLFFRTQEIQYLSSRLVVLAATLVGLVWLGIILVHRWRSIPAATQQHLEKERFFRYLPKKRTK